jgi:glycosyltransferase involved in cell wall biosynthesis
MKIGILGTRGIPNNYGGFEQCAEYLALGLVGKGHDVTVYNSHKHVYKESCWKEINIVHCFDPEYKLGTAGQFIYDLNCIIDSRRRKFDIILQLGYSSSSIWGWLLPRRSIITTNMDGLEWKRLKYSRPVKRFLMFSEYLAVLFSDHLISDSRGIQKYLMKKYNKKSVYIPYGAEQLEKHDLLPLKELEIFPYNYYIIIARMEPENNIETILEGIVKSDNSIPVLVIGNTANKHGIYLINKFKNNLKIRFIGAIYDINILNSLRFYSTLYFHGHSVGGTNPSLLEAMACNCLICANDNEFNRDVLGKDSFYFKTSEDISVLLKEIENKTAEHKIMITRNLSKISDLFNWERIVQMYDEHFNKIIHLRK